MTYEPKETFITLPNALVKVWQDRAGYWCYELYQNGEMENYSTGYRLRESAIEAASKDMEAFTNEDNSLEAENDRLRGALRDIQSLAERSCGKWLDVPMSYVPNDLKDYQRIWTTAFEAVTKEQP